MVYFLLNSISSLFLIAVTVCDRVVQVSSLMVGAPLWLYRRFPRSLSACVDHNSFDDGMAFRFFPLCFLSPLFSGAVFVYVVYLLGRRHADELRKLTSSFSKQCLQRPWSMRGVNVVPLKTSHSTCRTTLDGGWRCLQIKELSGVLSRLSFFN